MKSDKEIIQEAYEDAVKEIFAVFLSNLITPTEKDAVGKFRIGLVLARHGRDEAIKVVEQ